MKWKKSPPELIERFDAAVAGFPAAERKQMFGYPSIFVNGNLTAGLFQDRIMFRLSEEDRSKFLKRSGTGVFEPMKGRPMKDYVESPGSLAENSAEFRAWLGR